jgi:SAM-dependent methyltransferase
MLSTPLWQRLAGRVFDRAIRRDSIRRWVEHRLTDQSAMFAASFAKDMPPGLTHVSGFEDCAWLLTSSELNHGLSRLRLDEAAYLYRLVRAFPAARVAELGRYKGGSAFLMAAAEAAQVVSIDNGRIPGQQTFVPQLIEALARAGLRDRVEVVDADAAVYPVEAESFDIVFFDCAMSFAIAAAMVEHWWPAVRAGGVFLIRDGKDSLLTEAVRYTRSIDPDAIGADIDMTPPGAFVTLLKRRHGPS